RSLVAQPHLEPYVVHAIARPIDIAAQQALVRLHVLGRLSGDLSAHRAGEAPIAPQPSEVGRIAEHGLDQLQPRLRPAPGVERDCDAAFEQCFECRLDKALRAAEGRIALADDSEPHRGAGSSLSARISLSAAWTRATGSVVRHSDTLPPPQPSLPQGRHGCSVDATIRCGTCHGPHSTSPLGPNNATTGVPIAAAMCIGAESTPTNARAWRVNAASSRKLSAPERSVTCARTLPASRASVAATSCRSRSSGAPVTTTRQPSPTIASISAE